MRTSISFTGLVEAGLHKTGDELPLEQQALIFEFTRPGPVPFVREIELHQAQELVPLWQATEWHGLGPQPPPFWAFAWPGSQALARYILDNGCVAAGRRVLDFGSGSGLAAIAAAKSGASCVIACDVDPIATVAQGLNAALNDVLLTSLTCDGVNLSTEVDLILAGDVCYEREAAEQTLHWLRKRAASCEVLIADPGRHYAPSEGLELLAVYDVPALRELESVDMKRTKLWRLLA